MVAIIKNNFRLHGAKEFLKNFSSTVTDKNHYLFVGKPLPWRAPEGQLDNVTITSSNADLYPPMPQGTTFEDKRIWDEMLGLKRIGSNDVSLVIPRSDWRERTVYAIFDDSDPDLYRKPTLNDVQRVRNSTTQAELSDPALGYRKAGNFYVLNSLNELFVCVWNNDNAVSTEEPQRLGDPNNLIVLEDGYVWKYITSVTSSDAAKFLTDAWLPIRTLSLGEDNGTGQRQVQDDSKSGELLAIVVKNTTAPGETPTTFPNTFTGTVTIAAASAGVLSNPAISTENAYRDYQIHVTDNSTNTTTIFNITGSISQTGDVTVSIDGTFTGNNLTINSTYSCKILPKLNVYSNGTQPPVLEPVVDSSTKRLTGVSIKSRGLNATFVAVSVSRPAVPVDGTSVLPTIRPILSTTNGLGKDPEKDLGAFYVMVSTQIKYTEGENQLSNLADFPVKNDYRQIGILQNAITNTEQPVLCTSPTLRATKRIKIQFLDSEDALGIPGDPGFKSDELIDLLDVNDNVVGKIRSVDFKFFDRSLEDEVYQGEITFIQTPETLYDSPIVNQKIRGQVSGATARIDLIENEELKPFKGDILYIENRRPVLRSVDQIEDIKTIIEF